MGSKKYHYYAVELGEKGTYWYRSGKRSYHKGTKVIVPLQNKGLWMIGTVVEKRVVTEAELPYPLLQTKGIVERAGWFGKSKVAKRNRYYASLTCPILDISQSVIETEHGRVRYCTCEEERCLRRLLKPTKKQPYVTVELYPASPKKEIPREARLALKAEQKRLRRIRAEIRRQEWAREMERRRMEKMIDAIQLESENAWEEFMEELDQFN